MAAVKHVGAVQPPYYAARMPGGPEDLYREPLRTVGVSSSEELGGRRDGETVRVAGMVIVRQRPPSAKGHVFFTLEDETGLVNLIVRPKVYERYRQVLRNAPLLLVEGRLQREREAQSVLVEQATTMFREKYGIDKD